jgi:hypothetical protein
MTNEKFQMENGKWLFRSRHLRLPPVPAPAS